MKSVNDLLALIAEGSIAMDSIAEAVRKIISDADHLTAFTSGSVQEGLIKDKKVAQKNLYQLEMAIKMKDESLAKQSAAEENFRNLIGSMEYASVLAIELEYSEVCSSLDKLSVDRFSPMQYEQKWFDFCRDLKMLERLMQLILGTEREIIESEILNELKDAGLNRIIENSRETKQIFKDKQSEVHILAASIANKYYELIQLLEAKMIDHYEGSKKYIETKNVSGVSAGTRAVASGAHRVS